MRILILILFVLVSQNIVESDYRYQWNPLTNQVELLPKKYKTVYNFSTNSYVYIKQ